jgi:predicted dinucleotide-binding enzyme
MKIGIIGAGRMGLALGGLWAKAGHDVLFSYSRDRNKLVALAQTAAPGARVGSPADAVTFGDVVVLAVPWSAWRDAMAQGGPMAGKIVLSLVNPMNDTYSDLVVGHTTSGAEEIANLAPGARVVEALNAIFAETLQSGPLRFGDQVPTVFFCGDDAAAKRTVAELIACIGAEGVDAGDLTAARYIEPLGMLYTRLAYGLGMGANIAPKMLRR